MVKGRQGERVRLYVRGTVLGFKRQARSFSQIEVESVREHFAGPDRGGEHEGGGGLVRREAHGVRLQGEGEEGRFPLPLHLGQGHPPPREQRGCPCQVQVQPATKIHGCQGQGFHVSQQYMRYYFQVQVHGRSLEGL
ncbi:60S ribosomal protein L35a-4 [Iris pallida]|uniref:60S ribosomal protein L35a-4 n=1 Tax=Iris pallida TaxID=29817 RepID=A0AAX6GJN6_IRIPA|nr:60S ribosomal protein L35a-4 [Iris pallida]